MKKPYSDLSLAVDLIINEHGNISPVQICVKSKEDLDILITPSQVIDYLNVSEDFEKESWRLHSNEIFNNYE